MSHWKFKVKSRYNSVLIKAPTKCDQNLSNTWELKITSGKMWCWLVLCSFSDGISCFSLPGPAQTGSSTTEEFPGRGKSFFWFFGCFHVGCFHVFILGCFRMPHTSLVCVGRALKAQPFAFCVCREWQHLKGAWRWTGSFYRSTEWQHKGEWLWTVREEV